MPKCFCIRCLPWRGLHLLIFFIEVIKFYWLMLLYPGELYRLLWASSLGNSSSYFKVFKSFQYCLGYLFLLDSLIYQIFLSCVDFFFFLKVFYTLLYLRKLFFNWMVVFSRHYQVVLQFSVYPGFFLTILIFLKGFF